jgi:hypothetical protein
LDRDHRVDPLAIRKERKKSIEALAHKMPRTIDATVTVAHTTKKPVDYEALGVAWRAARRVG